MASSPITSQQIDGKTVETVTDFIFLGFKITADGDCSHEIKGHLLLGWKAMTNLDSILKGWDLLCWQRSIWSKLWFFPLAMYRCENWTIKKAEHQIIYAFKLVLEKTLESPLNCKEIKLVSPKSTMNIHWKDWCWSSSSNTLAIWCKELTHWKRP